MRLSRMRMVPSGAKRMSSGMQVTRDSPTRIFSKKKRSQICEYELLLLSLSPKSERSMIVTFEEDYLRELYEDGQASDKKHRFQPQIIKKYTRVVDLMMEEANVMGLTKYGGLHYEHLHGDKEGLSSVKVNDQYRIEFREILDGDKTIAEMVSLTELSNHYKNT